MQFWSSGIYTQPPNACTIKATSPSLSSSQYQQGYVPFMYNSMPTTTLPKRNYEGTILSYDSVAMGLSNDIVADFMEHRYYTSLLLDHQMLMRTNTL